METINKLLKKQAPKTNARRKEFNAIANEATPDTELVKPEPGFVRWVSNKEGNRIGVPEEWLDAPVGNLFSNSVKPSAGKMVQEVS
jgi:Ino eighty subunit 2